MRLTFRLRLLEYHTPLNAFLLGDGNVPPHPIVAGNASAEVGTGSIHIFAASATPSVETLLSTAVLTPNGDGVNDEVEVAAVLTQFAGEVPLAIEIFDLSGLRVRELIAAPPGRGSLSRNLGRPGWDRRKGRARSVPMSDRGKLRYCLDHRDATHRSGVLTAFLLVPLLLLAGTAWGQASSWVVGSSGEPWADVAERWIASTTLCALEPSSLAPCPQDTTCCADWCAQRVLPLRSTSSTTHGPLPKTRIGWRPRTNLWVGIRACGAATER